MKVKRYFASNMRSALEMVKQEQGADVLILSNRKVDGGVELVTADELTEKEAERLVERRNTPSRPASPREEATPVQATKMDSHRKVNAAHAPVEPPPPRARGARPTPSLATATEEFLWTDERTVAQMREDLNSLKGLLENQLSSLAWSDFGTRHPLRARLLRVLSRVGIAPALARDLVNHIDDGAEYRDGWHQVLGIMMTRLNVMQDPVLEDGGRIALLGPTGAGKTTLVSKLAARYALRHGPDAVVIVSMDDRRLGAHQQMKSFGRLIGSPVYAMRDRDELAALLDTLSARPLVLIDTPGNAPHDPRYRELVLGLDALNANIQMYNVISATTDYLATRRMLDATATMALDACVLTKLDEAATLGPTLSSIIETGLPLAYTSAGQRVPDDLDRADPRALIERTVALAREIPGDSDTSMLEQAFGA